MKDYEKNLQFFLNYLKNTGERTTSTRDVDISRDKLLFLAAKGLLELKPYTNGDPNFKIYITDKAITYFDDKRQRIFDIVLTALISIAVSFVSSLAINLLMRV